MSLIDKLSRKVAAKGLPHIVFEYDDGGGCVAWAGKYSGWGTTGQRALFNLLCVIEADS